MKRKGKILIQLLVLMLLIDFTAETVLAWISYKSAEQNLANQISNSLSAIASRQIDYFNQEINQKIVDIEALASIPQIVQVFSKNYIDASQLGFYQNAFHFQNLILVKNDGTILYDTQKKEAQNQALRSYYQNTDWIELLERTQMVLQTEVSDIKAEQNFITLASPVYENKKLLGFIIAQFDNARIIKVCQNYIGLGKTGQTLLWANFEQKVGLITPLRNNANKKNVQIPFSKIPIYLQEALKGQFGQGLQTDFWGKEVWAFWAYVPILRAAIEVKIEKDEVFEPVKELQLKLLSIVTLTLFFVVLSAISLANYFTKPIIKLTKLVQEVRNGKLDQQIYIKRNNEIGILADNFNEMTQSLHQKTQELNDYNAHLEQRVAQRTEELNLQKQKLQEHVEELQIITEELQQQTEEVLAQRDALENSTHLLNTSNNEIQKKNKDILASIAYAQRIQGGLLPKENTFAEAFSEYFIIYKPRDIVSGDFYWVHNAFDATVLICADCTGHGVPGALMSMIGIQVINKIVINFGIVMPEDILQELHYDLTKIVRKSNEQSDTMDISVCTIFFDQKVVYFAGAMQSLCYIQNNELYQLKGNKIPIGLNEESAEYTPHQISFANSQTWLYLFSDGYADQFGGKNDRRIMSKKLKELFLQNHQLHAQDQKNILENFFDTWKANQDQIDDVTVLGILLA